MASGSVVINGKAIENPSGCYQSATWPLRVDNQTDTGAAIYNRDDCTGEITETVQPGDRKVIEFGVCVSFPCPPCTSV